MGHGFRDAMFDICGQEVRVKMAKILVLSVLVDNWALPSDMGNVLDLLATMGTQTLRQAYVLKVIFSPGSTGRDVAIHSPLFFS